MEFAQLIQDITGVKGKVSMKKSQQDDPHKRKPDITVAKTQLGWEPKVINNNNNNNNNNNIDVDDDVVTQQNLVGISSNLLHSISTSICIRKCNKIWGGHLKNNQGYRPWLFLKWP